MNPVIKERLNDLEEYDPKLVRFVTQVLNAPQPISETELNAQQRIEELSYRLDKSKELLRTVLKQDTLIDKLNREIITFIKQQ